MFIFSVTLFSRYDTLNKLAYFAFQFAGLLHKEGTKLFSIFTAYQIISMHISVTVAIIELFVGSREVKDIVGTLSTAVTVTCAISRALRFLSRRKKIINILDRLEIIRIKMLKDQDNKHFVTEAENFGKRVLAGVFISLNGFPFPSFMWYTISDLTMEFKQKHLVLKVWTPWNFNNVWTNIVTNAMISIMSFTCLTVYVGIHFMEITFTLYVSAYIKTLQNKLINKGIKNEEIYEQHKVIIQLIKDHNEVLSGIKYLETQISPLMPCGFGYVSMRALKRNEINEAVDNCVRAILCLMPSVVTCCCGQQIITEMEKLHEATYMSKWYKEEPKFRKDLLTMMIRTTNPPTINYRLFVKFDHVLLALVLQTVYSYMMLMVNLDAE
ncbi:hypothetical protein O3M35_002577 [Rhynocoris fuscipes]|uniref:Odorant receptor n=1 Tax=Rhynocoris fuscipes TaxID=488301 RepID=A0AAW1CMA6_9HEMI